MKHLFSILCCLWISTATFAQQKVGNISGKLMDSKTKEAVGYATVSVKKDGKIIDGILSEDNGSFSIKNLPLDKLVLEVQFIGYKTLQREVPLTPTNPTVTLNNLLLEEEAITLNEVNIVAERSTIEQKVDRKVINVGKDLTTVGATASEIMSNIPSVNVDQDGNLSLRGNTNVKVLVDGRPSNMNVAELLKQIPSTSIKKVELITNPSAKYNPEGMSGIINIVLHKNTNNGFNGSFNTGITFAKTPKFNNSFNGNYRHNKFNFYTTLGNNVGDYLNRGSIHLFDDGSDQLTRVNSGRNSQFGKIGFDYFIDDYNTLSVYTNQNATKNKTTINSSILFDNPINDILEDDFYNSKIYNAVYNVAYKHKFKKEGHTLDFEGSYNTSTTKQNANFYPVGGGLIPYEDSTKPKDNSALFNLDYTNPLNEKTTLEVGGEYRFSRTESDYNTSRVGVDNAFFTYDFDIVSFYTTFGQKFNKFSYQLGARLEHYQVEADFIQTSGRAKFDNKYFTVYPSAYLTYSLTEKDMLQLSIARRVDRPSVGQTKPIRDFATPRFTNIGNPELLPQFTNSVELNYTKTINKSSITAGVFFRDINDQISQTIGPDESTPIEERKIIMSFGNFDKNTSYGFEASANLKMNNWWDMQPSIDFSSINQKGMNAILDEATQTFDYRIINVKTDAFNARINNNFKVNKAITLSLFGFYRGPVNEITMNAKSMFFVDLGGRYSFWNNKASLTLRFSDISKDMRFRYDATSPYTSNGAWKWESQKLYVGFNYMFGGSSGKTFQRKSRDKGDSQQGGFMN